MLCSLRPGRRDPMHRRVRGHSAKAGIHPPGGGPLYGDWIPGDWNKGTEEKMSLVIREPLGVVAAIVPFNYPLHSRNKVVPALLAGNSVVVKPSSTNPISATMLTRILQMAGVPEAA